MPPRSSYYQDKTEAAAWLAKVNISLGRHPGAGDLLKWTRIMREAHRPPASSSKPVGAVQRPEWGKPSSMDAAVINREIRYLCRLAWAVLLVTEPADARRWPRRPYSADDCQHVWADAMAVVRGQRDWWSVLDALADRCEAWETLRGKPHAGAAALAYLEAREG